jgi:hypothetical protein
MRIPMRKPWKKCSLVLLAMAFLGCRSGKSDDVFPLIDSDKSGYLTLSEVEDYGFRRMFGRFDTDGDGAITSSDLQSGSPNLMRTRDLNRDGQVTFEEYEKVARRQGLASKLFSAADANSDGKISEEETGVYLRGSGSTTLGE